MTTEAIILIPGMKRSAVHNQRARFIAGLEHVWEGDALARAEDGPPDGVRLVAREQGRTLDVYEAYWNDLVPSLTEQGLRARVLRGLSLTGYWAFSGIWRGITGRPSLTVGTMTAGLVLVAWYLGVLLLFADALAANPDLLFGVTVPETARAAIGAVGTWWLWLLTSVLTVVVPVSVVVDIMDFAKIYASEEVVEDDELALRFQVVSRVRDQIRRALANEAYSRVTIVGHSFGAVLAVDVMSDLPLPDDTRLRMVTLGSPAELLARKAAWLDAEIDACAARPDLDEWVDIVSRADWLASGTSPKTFPKVREVGVRPHGTLVDRVAAKVHSRYFDSQEAINEIVG